MIYVTYFFAGVFILLSATMLYVFYRSLHFGTFLMGVTYGASGVIAIWIEQGWPLVVGFAAAWIFKFMGLEPAAESGDDGAGKQAEGGPVHDAGRGEEKGRT